MDWTAEPNKRALAILRVSSARQKDGLSHDVQEAEIVEYCKASRAGETYPGKHQLIIPTENLAKVKASFRSKGNNPRLQTTAFPSGWLRCADPACGCYITFDPKTKLLVFTRVDPPDFT